MSNRSLTCLFLAMAAAVLTLLGAAEAGPPFVMPLDTDDACPSWRWIGITTDTNGACPVPESPTGEPPWQVSNLFLSSDDGSLKNIPPGLRPYCLYEHATGNADKEITALVPRYLSAVARDCLAVGSAGDELEQQTWAGLEKHFLDQAGAVPFAESSGPPVRFALIDTQPRSEGKPDLIPGSSPHGYTLANIARRLLCSDSPRQCVAHLASHLALPYLSYHNSYPALSERDEVNGGFVGTFGDLANALREAVATWQRRDPPETRLVLHLAVAWQGSGFGGDEDDVVSMSPAVRAVHSAIVDGVCRGALVVAAAGNTAGGPEAEEGPLLPAAWQMLPAPTEAQCKSLVNDSCRSFGRTKQRPGRPLLWAAGGITSGGRPLANARPQGMPCLTAVADHAVVEGHLPGVPTATLTGSSVATTVVAAAAAAVWYYRPELDRTQVMQVLLDAGDDLGWQADLCAGSSGACVSPGAPQNGRRVSVCQSVALACMAPGVSCSGGVPYCPTWTPALPALATGPISAFQDFSPLAAVDGSWVPAGPEPACVPQTLHPNPAYPAPADPCPHSQYYGLASTPWVGTQPGSNPCPNCLLSTGHQAMLVEIDDDFSGFLSSPTLLIDGSIFNLAPYLLSDSALIELPGLVIPATADVALSFTVNGSSSVTSPVLVVP